MANIWKKAISTLAGNLNSGRCYLITAVKSQAKRIKLVTYVVTYLISTYLTVNRVAQCHANDPLPSSLHCNALHTRYVHTQNM